MKPFIKFIKNSKGQRFVEMESVWYMNFIYLSKIIDSRAAAAVMDINRDLIKNSNTNQLKQKLGPPWKFAVKNVSTYLVMLHPAIGMSLIRWNSLQSSVSEFIFWSRTFKAVLNICFAKKVRGKNPNAFKTVTKD